MNRLAHHVRSNAIAYLALFVALGGTSYAAINLPAGSVGTSQLKNGAVTTNKLANGSVTPKKVDPRGIGGSVIHWASVSKDGKVLGGSRGAHVSAGAGLLYRVSWSATFPSHCAVLTSSPGVAAHAPIADSIGTQILQGTTHGPSTVWVFPFSGGAATAAPFDIAIVC